MYPNMSSISRPRSGVSLHPSICGGGGGNDERLSSEAELEYPSSSGSWSSRYSATGRRLLGTKIEPTAWVREEDFFVVLRGSALVEVVAVVLAVRVVRAGREGAGEGLFRTGRPMVGTWCGSCDVAWL